MTVDIELTSGQSRLEISAVDLDGRGEQELTARQGSVSVVVRLNVIGRIVILTALPEPDNPQRTVRWVITERLSPQWIGVSPRWDASREGCACRVRLHDSQPR